ncbi:MAG: DUF3667 domain-containing protein [Gemmatimonadaceae bacterium]
MQTRDREQPTFTPPVLTALQEQCVTCGNAVDTPFCAQCGEKRASDRTYSLWTFFKDHVVESVLSFDGRIIRTLTTLLRKPGELTREFMRGVRLPYLAPLQCFLLLNLGFFVWSSWAGMRIYDTPLWVHMNAQPYSRVATAMVRGYLGSHQIAEPVYHARFNAIGAAQARSLVLVMIPAFAAAAALIMLRRRRAPLVQHLVFALHTYSFVFILMVAARYLIYYPLNVALDHFGVAGNGPLGHDTPDGIALLAVLTTYLALSLRRVYDIGWARAGSSGVALGMIFFIVLQLYRALLFFVTFYSM